MGIVVRFVSQIRILSDSGRKRFNNTTLKSNLKMKIIQDSGEGNQIGGNDIVRINRAYKRFLILIRLYDSPYIFIRSRVNRSNF